MMNKMNRKGALPLLILIPLIIVAIIVGFFILRWVIGTLITIMLWAIGIVFVIIALVVIYFIIKWFRKKTRRKK